MNSPAARITLAAVILVLITALAAPMVALADDALGAATSIVEADVSVETSASADPEDSADATAAAVPVEVVATDAENDAETDTSVPASSSAPVLYSSQSGTDTRSAIEALLKVRKRQFDRVTLDLRRTIDRLAASIRAEEAQGGNVTTAKAQLARARAALQRAYVLERAATAKYRAVPTADDQRAQYEKAKQAARTSTAQLVTVTKLLRNLVPSAKLLACLQPLRSGVDSA